MITGAAAAAIVGGGVGILIGKNMGGSAEAHDGNLMTCSIPLHQPRLIKDIKEAEKQGRAKRSNSVSELMFGRGGGGFDPMLVVPTVQCGDSMYDLDRKKVYQAGRNMEEAVTKTFCEGKHLYVEKEYLLKHFPDAPPEAAFMPDKMCIPVIRQ